jgi:poly(hydroxyalkanoate) depolymerase family esterase
MKSFVWLGMGLLIGLAGATIARAGDQGATFPYPTCYPFTFNCMETTPGNWPGFWVQGVFVNDAGTRNYSVYVPSTYKKGQGRVPLMMMLHGCQQDVNTFATESGMNLVAEKYGFVVLYPEQGYIDNGMKCWNWFLPINQERHSGELSIAVGMIDIIDKDVPIDRSRVYVSGLSAGGAMASNLLACYSDVFAGGGISAGLEYKAADNVNDAWNAGKGPTNDLSKTGVEAAHCTGSGAQMENLITIQGTADQYINPINANRILTQFSVMNDLLDDGVIDNSETTSVITTQSAQVPNGYPYSIDYFGSSTGTIHMARVTVDGMKHAWSGATKEGQYADPKGPPASELIWEFLSQFTR